MISYINNTVYSTCKCHLLLSCVLAVTHSGAVIIMLYTALSVEVGPLREVVRTRGSTSLQNG